MCRDPVYERGLTRCRAIAGASRSERYPGTPAALRAMPLPAEARQPVLRTIVSAMVDFGLSTTSGGSLRNLMAARKDASLSTGASAATRGMELLMVLSRIGRRTAHIGGPACSAGRNAATIILHRFAVEP